MNISKDSIKDVTGFIVMMIPVSATIFAFPIKDTQSYLVGLALGFGMPLFTKIWNKYITIN